MLNYAIKRINGALLVVVAVSVITFVMLTQISGNAARMPPQSSWPSWSTALGWTCPGICSIWAG